MGFNSGLKGLKILCALTSSEILRNLQRCTAGGEWQRCHSITATTAQNTGGTKITRTRTLRSAMLRTPWLKVGHAKSMVLEEWKGAVVRTVRFSCSVSR